MARAANIQSRGAVRRWSGLMQRGLAGASNGFNYTAFISHSQKARRSNGVAMPG